MSIFEKVTEHVVATAGSETLHTVDDINSAERFATLSLVEKRRSFWFWKNARMIPTFVKLNDLLIQGEDITATERQFTLLRKFDDNPKLNLNGSIEIAGTLAKKIAAQVNFNLEATDKVELAISLGDIAKSAVSFQELREAMGNKTIDVTHPLYISAAQQAPKTSLCIVIEALYTKDNGSIKEDSDKKISASVGATAGPNRIQVNAKVAGSVESKNSQSYTIPPGTILAYGCIEMSCDAEGKVSLHSIEDTMDPTPAPLSLPENPFAKIKNELHPLICASKLHEYQEEIKSLLMEASETDFRVIQVLFYYANSKTSMTFTTLKHLIGCDITLKWEKFMSNFGFKIYEEPNNGNTVIFPQKIEGDLHKACLALVDSILSCRQNSRRDIPTISHDHTHVLMKIIEEEFKNKGILLDDPELKSMVSNDPSTLTCLEDCGFKKAAGNKLIFTGGNSYELLDIFVVMYFLSANHKHCCIL